MTGPFKLRSEPSCFGDAVAEIGREIHAIIKKVLEERAERHELIAYELARQSLPKRMCWLLRYPRLLDLYWKLRPLTRPMMKTYDITEGGEVFVTCGGLCHEGAVYVPCVGPMGDSSHRTIEEAAKSGRFWQYNDRFKEWLCPDCVKALT